MGGKNTSQQGGCDQAHFAGEKLWRTLAKQKTPLPNEALLHPEKRARVSMRTSVTGTKGESRRLGW